MKRARAEEDEREVELAKKAKKAEEIKAVNGGVDVSDGDEDREKEVEVKEEEDDDDVQEIGSRKRVQGKNIEEEEEEEGEEDNEEEMEGDGGDEDDDSEEDGEGVEDVLSGNYNFTGQLVNSRILRKDRQKKDRMEAIPIIKILMERVEMVAPEMTSNQRVQFYEIFMNPVDRGIFDIVPIEDQRAWIYMKLGLLEPLPPSTDPLHRTK